jgi:hypothetical protein
LANQKLDSLIAELAELAGEEGVSFYFLAVLPDKTCFNISGSFPQKDLEQIGPFPFHGSPPTSYYLEALEKREKAIKEWLDQTGNPMLTNLIGSLIEARFGKKKLHGR